MFVEHLRDAAASESSIVASKRGLWTGNRSLEQSAAQLRAFATALSRARWLLLAWILFWATASLLYAMSMKAEFVAKVNVLIEPQQIASAAP